MSSRHIGLGGWLRLDDAARRLGVTPQVLWAQVVAAGGELRRVELAGRAVALVRVADLGQPLALGDASSPAEPEESGEDDGGVGASIWSQLQALREERDLFEQTLERLVAERREREELAGREWVELGVELDDARARIDTAEGALAAAERRAVELLRRLEQAEGRLEALQREAAQALEHASECARARDSALEFEGARRTRLERELAVLRESERANQRYLDRLEAELRAARGERRVG